MLKIILSIFIIIGTLPAFADYITTGNSFYNNGFNSKLKMNQPKNIVVSSPAVNNNLGYPNRCAHCRDYYPPYQPLSRNNLSALEKYALRKTYGNESELHRLERLENLAFGAIQSGNPLIRYRNVENAILSRPQYGTKQSMLSNIANYFAGQSTGFTPSITSYPHYTNCGGFSSNPYMHTPQYNNSAFEQYSNGIFGGGWGISGHDFGTGSSVRILD